MVNPSFLVGFYLLGGCETSRPCFMASIGPREAGSPRHGGATVMPKWRTPRVPSGKLT